MKKASCQILMLIIKCKNRKKYLSVVQREKKERNASNIGFNLEHNRSRREIVEGEIERVVRLS
jgi:hypothetical protein